MLQENRVGLAILSTEHDMAALLDGKKAFFT